MAYSCLMGACPTKPPPAECIVESASGHCCAHCARVHDGLTSHPASRHYHAVLAFPSVKLKEAVWSLGQGPRRSLCGCYTSRCDFMLREPGVQQWTVQYAPVFHLTVGIFVHRDDTEHRVDEPCLLQCRMLLRPSHPQHDALDWRCAEPTMR